MFNTHIPTYLNINHLSKKEMLKLTNMELNEDKIKEFKEFALEKYGEYVCVPISMIMLSKFKLLKFK